MIVLEKFVCRLMDFDKEKDSMKSILDDLSEEYEIPSYRKVMDALVATIFKQVN